MCLQLGSRNVHIHARRDTAGWIGEEDDVGFQSLRFVKIHQPDDVTVPRLKWKRLDLACRFAIRLQCIGRGGETSPFFYYLPNAVNGVKNIPRVDASRCCCSQCQVASVFEDAAERGCRGKNACPSVVFAQRTECGMSL